MACDSNKNKIKKTLEHMQSAPISVPYEDMKCWTNDSIKESSPWKHAKLKMVHYIDSAQCSSCYLAKKQIFASLIQLETESNNMFYNYFIVCPGNNSKNWKLLTYNFEQKNTPATLFIDTANVFMSKNPNLPKEMTYHTFLLDENNKVVFVGSPFDENIRNKTIAIIKQKLSNLKD